MKKSLCFLLAFALLCGLSAYAASGEGGAGPRSAAGTVAVSVSDDGVVTDDGIAYELAEGGTISMNGVSGLSSTPLTTAPEACPTPARVASRSAARTAEAGAATFW